MTALGYRARRILYATITEYVATGEPVGSRTLSRRHGLNLSPATIRNVLADLEDGGYLAQPHTSAGRIPTSKGFRVFVDALVQMRSVSEEDRETVVSRFQKMRAGDDVLREAGKILSSLTGTVAVVRGPQVEDVITQMRFVRLREGELVVVIVTRSGSVTNRVVQAAAPDTSTLDRIHNYLDELFAAGLALGQARERIANELQAVHGELTQLRASAHGLLQATERAQPPRSDDFVIEGQQRLLDQPEFADTDSMRTAMRAIDDRARILEVLDGAMAQGGIQVLIGTEANLGEGALSVVSATATGSPNGTGASVGVIGPTRMDYGKVVPIVGFTARVMSNVLEGKNADPVETDVSDPMRTDIVDDDSSG